MTNPVTFSIVMPTLNSSRTIRRALESIRSQEFDQSRVEILVVDGGSKDDTLKIAQEYGAIIVANVRKLPEFAKLVGTTSARGEYVVFNDSDEVMENLKALEHRARAFAENPHLSTLATQGDIRPAGYPLLLDYYNLIGDPFSYYVGRSGIAVKYAADRFAQRYKVVKNTSDYLTFEVDAKSFPPTYDAGGHTFRRETLLRLVEKHLVTGDASFIGAISTLLSLDGRGFIVTKKDFVEHHSDASVRLIVKKIKFRIVNNMFKESGSPAGYVDREQFLPRHKQLRKFGFIPYGLTLVFPTWDGLVNSVFHRNLSFMWHPIFAFLTALMIGYYMLLKLVGQKRSVSQYG